MKKLIIALIILSVMPVYAHFQVLVPSTDVAGNNNRKLAFNMFFTHPFEQGPVMEMKKPLAADVYVNGKKESLMPALKQKKVNGKTGWDFAYTLKTPGDHIFTVTPDYYFEPAEGVFIQHITKVVVNAFGMENTWGDPVGLKAEIVPLTRPYGLWKGNIFTGQVFYKGKPVANAEIEVELYNVGKKIKHPTDMHITQVVKADKNGVFSYAMPFAGWWSFAALIEDDVKVKRDGKTYPVELGALIWVKAYGE